MKTNSLSKERRSKSLLAMTIDSIKYETTKNFFSGISDKESTKENFRTSSNKNLILTQRENKINSLKYSRNQNQKNKKFELKKEITQTLKEENVNKGNY